MKMSKLLRVASQMVFWCPIILFSAWLFKLYGATQWLVLMTVLTVIGTGFARMVKNKLLGFLCHALVMVVPGILVVTNKLALMALFFGLAIIILSLMSTWAESEFMEKPHGFGQFVLFVVYFVGTIMEYPGLVFHFIMFVAYTFLIFLERNIKENEDYIHGVSYTSVMDIKKMHVVSNMVTFIISLGMLTVCVIVSMLGQLGPVRALSAFLTSKLKNVLGFLKQIDIDFWANTRDPQNGNKLPDADKDPFQGNANMNGDISELNDTLLDKVVFWILIIITIIALFVIIFLIFRKLYKKYLLSQKDGVEENQTIITKAKKARKENLKKTDASYSNRKAVRKLYKKQVKGKSGRREDFVNFTPREQVDKSRLEGNEIKEEILGIYEKARYSKEEITKEDVKNMKK